MVDQEGVRNAEVADDEDAKARNMANEVGAEYVDLADENK